MDDGYGSWLEGRCFGQHQHRVAVADVRPGDRLQGCAHTVDHVDHVGRWFRFYEADRVHPLIERVEGSAVVIVVSDHL